MKFKRAVLLAAISVASMTALAQWQWLDKDGRKVYSDRPPPLDTPGKNILTQPAMRPGIAPVAAPPAASAASAPANAAAAAPVPRPAGTDAALEEKKKQAEQAEATRLKAAEEKNRAIKAENCSRARQAKAGFDSGIRMARTNAKGELEFLDDAARAAEANRIDGIIRAECN